MSLTLPSVDDVRVLVPAPHLTDAQVQLFIDDAALIAENCVACLSATRQATIIKYLAAHLIMTVSSSYSSSSGATPGSLQSQSLGDASESYSVAATSDMLKGTVYGQQAMLLDPNGCLANLGKRGTRFVVIGPNRSREHFDPTLPSGE